MLKEMILLIPKLIEEYPDIVIGDLCEKDIIYFCRVKLHADKDKPLFEKEILSIIKSKYWDWFAKDIDSNIILAYPIRHNAFPIVQYLLENNIYDLKEYNKDISNALCSFGLNYKAMLHYILTYDPHPDYMTDICRRAYDLSSRVSNKNRETYFEMALLVNSKNTNFKTIVNSFIHDAEDFPPQITSFLHFLNNHPLPISEKNIILDTLFDKKDYTKEQTRYYHLDDKMHIVEKWKLFHYLENNMTNNQEHKSKMKI